MSTKLDQKAYLQKYLTGKSSDKKKKKSKKVVKGKGFKIIDDDLDITKLRPLDGDELDILDHGEDAPQVAGIIDERPEEVRKMEEFKVTSRWRVINEDDGFNSKLQVEEIKSTVTEKRKENELIFGKMYSDSEDEKNNDSDAPTIKDAQSSKKKGQESKKPQNNSDSDFSPPRRGGLQISNQKERTNTEQDSDCSPPRRKENLKTTDRIRKKSRWGDNEHEIDNSKSRRKMSDSDVSPSRKSRKLSPERHRRRERQNGSDSDVSPPRKSKKQIPQRRKQSTDSDLSPLRRRNKDDNRRRSPDSDQKNMRRRKSPLCRNNNKSTQGSRRSLDSDNSPPRKKKTEPQRSRRGSTDSDVSPPRRSSDKIDYRRSSDSPPPSNKKMAKTLEGKKAGLQDAKQLREENESFKRREAEVFQRMTDDVSGRNAQVVSRKQAKRETSEERKKLKEKAAMQKELDEKYKKWSKGIKQLEDEEQRIQDYIHEASKPLARHKGDKDLEDGLKRRERAGDPMLDYIRDKKRERGELAPERPMYKGNFPPNRYNIRPGFRWDGVDRSNGYEKKYFEQQSKRKAQEDEAYQWSTADL